MVIQVSETPLSKIIQNISFRYTRYINKRKKRIGHLFQGRYKAVLVDADSYLLELVRYIHHNPVRAGMVTDPAEHQWSSHQDYLGKGNIPFLTTDFVLSQFGEKKVAARKAYHDFILKGITEGRRADFHQGETDSRILGDDGFTDTVLNRKVTHKEIKLAAIIAYVCEQHNVDEKELRHPSRRRDYAELRGVIGLLAVQLKAAPLAEVAKHFNRDISTLSRIVHNVEKKFGKSKEHGTLLEQYHANILSE
ncbi:MAG: transposase [Proteobacteria bacterium]|nr:transposase [Pseudomonadota bacterium]MBU1715843.1 transposase [Pseudomonadota bacterium]